MLTRNTATLPDDSAAASAIRKPAMANRDYRLNRQAGARRHTRQVKRLRILMPVIGAMLGLTVVVLTILESYFLDPVVFIKSIFDGDGLVMTNPRLDGHSEKGRAYRLEAREARQPIDDTKTISLFDVKAFAEISDDDHANMTASTGVYKTAEEFLTLRKDIVVVTKSGYTIRAQEADIDLASGTLTANAEVTIKSEQLDLRSDKAKVTDQGKVITFIGNVKIIYQRGNGPASGAGQGTTQ